MKNNLLGLLKLVIFASLIGIGASSSVAAPGRLVDIPISAGGSYPPMTLLALSNDHQLYIKAYNDYSDLDGDGELDTTYKDTIDYYGYFDSGKCYFYSDVEGGVYIPTRAAGGDNSHTCRGFVWSGNFLNWATMTRIDVLRSVLYGGLRSLDTSSRTVLERSHIPRDVHAFVKVYTPQSRRENLNDFTPYSNTSVTDATISICNATYDADAVSHLSTAPPIMRVASGAWPYWASGSSTQCTWFDEDMDSGVASRQRLIDGSNTRIQPTHSLFDDIVDGIVADTFPQERLTENTVRVSVCSGSDPDEFAPNCREYTDGNYKPTGLLQEYGEAGDVRFGLIMGTYGGNKSGGAIKRLIQPFAGSASEDSEVNLNDGTFNTSVTNGIIETLSSLKVAQYSGSSYLDCSAAGIRPDEFGPSALDTRKCSNWANPVSEIYLEALRYISHRRNGAVSTDVLEPRSLFNADDSDLFSELTPINTWTDPYEENLNCANCNIILISTGLNSFDTDDLSSASDIRGLDSVSTINNYLDETIAPLEGIINNDYFVGEAGGVDDDRCTAKRLTDLSSVRGSCPEAPSQEGGYHVAGLAYHARITDLRDDVVGSQNIDTYAVSLAESAPTINIPVGGNTVSFVPICESNNIGEDSDEDPTTFNTASTTDHPWLACSLADIIVEESPSGDNQTGSFIVLWEDSSWGNDYDMDAIVRITYCVGSECSPSVRANQVQFSVEGIGASAGFAMQMGYTISGVGSDDGARFGVLWRGDEHPGETSGNPYHYLDGDRDNPAETGPWTVTYTASSTGPATTLENPLWYAAKYGGFNEQDDTPGPNLRSEWDVFDVNGNVVSGGDNIPDKYFPVSNPAQLASSLSRVLSVSSGRRSATSASFSSGRVTTESLLFLSRFDTRDWSGDLLAFDIDNNGIVGDAVWSAGQLLLSRTRSQAYNGSAADIAGSRDIFTFNGNRGVVFEFPSNYRRPAADEISDVMVDDLLSAAIPPRGSSREQRRYLQQYGGWIVDYIKGDSSRELGQVDIDGNELPGLLFRPRINDDAVRHSLGALVHSVPEFVDTGRIDSYPDDIEGTSDRLRYSQYNPVRTPLVLVGGNDGMLHAFNGTAINGEGGQEAFAYIPSFLSNGLSSLAVLPPDDYLPYVDGSQVIRDVYITGVGWQTYLVGMTRTGGQGIYVLNLTDSNNFDVDDVVGEFTHPELGYTFGRPEIVKLNNGRWAAIFGNGYNNEGCGTRDSGTHCATAKLFIVYLDTIAGRSEFVEGTHFEILETREGSLSAGRCHENDNDCNGLSTPVIADLNSDFVADRVYAGDVQGNLWAFDLSSDNPADWRIAGTSSSTRSPLFTACSDASSSSRCDATRQPITTQPSIRAHPTRLSSRTSPNLLIYFGTGQYLAENDDANEDIQSFYGVWDAGDSYTSLDRSDLDEQVFTSDAGLINVSDRRSPPATYRAISGGNYGWYIDFNINPLNTFDGGRSTIDSILLGEIIFFVISVPELQAVSENNSQICTPGGSSYLVGLNAYNGSAANFSVFGDDDNSPVRQQSGNVVGLSVILGTDGDPRIVTTTDTGSADSGSVGFDVVNANTPIPAGRKSWSIIR